MRFFVYAGDKMGVTITTLRCFICRALHLLPFDIKDGPFWDFHDVKEIRDIKNLLTKFFNFPKFSNIFSIFVKKVAYE